jgi:hypothetical protein
MASWRRVNLVGIRREPQFGVTQWLERNRVITSLDLAKRANVLPGLRQVHWDLVIVDEAHRMSAADESHKSLRYRLGELLRDISDHMLLSIRKIDRWAPCSARRGPQRHPQQREVSPCVSSL